MQINFTHLQELFINKVHKETGLILGGQDVSFEIRTNYQYPQYNLNIKVKVFGEEFSIGYPEGDNMEQALINDWYARLHDYNTDNAATHIIGLKIQALEKQYMEQIQLWKEKFLHQNHTIAPDDIDIEISDVVGARDENGFPKFCIFIWIKNRQVIEKEIPFKAYHYKLTEVLDAEIRIDSQDD